MFMYIGLSLIISLNNDDIDRLDMNIVCCVQFKLYILIIIVYVYEYK